MIIIKLQGGLGNQMFQYAAARALLKNKQFVYFDQSFLDSNNINNDQFTTRNYELYIFKCIRARKVKNWPIALFKSQSPSFKIVRRLLKSFIRYVQQFNCEYIPLVTVDEHKFLYLDGYFQSENYFKNYRKDILKDFQFPLLDAVNEILKKEIESTSNSVSVHIRRGDYLKPATQITHGVLSSDYYKKAITFLKREYNTLTLFVFSDDIDWAKANVKYEGSDINFVAHNSGVNSWKDMVVMSCCKHHIIANSSFSWWGAWLSDQKGITIAPKNWFNSKSVSFDINDIVPSKWILIGDE